MPGSTRVDLKTGSIPTKFCFVKRKEPRKPPKKRTLVERKQKCYAKDGHLMSPKQDDHNINISNRDMEEPELELLRQRVKEKTPKQL